MLEEKTLPLDLDDDKKQKRSRVGALIAYGIIAILWSGLLIYGMSIGAVVLNDLNTIMSLLLPLAAITGFVIAWRGRLDRAIWVFAVMWWIGALGIPLTRLTVARTGLITETVGGLLGFMVISIVAWMSASKGVRSRVIGIAGLMAIIVYGLSSLRPAAVAQTSSELQAASVIINIILGGVGVFVLIYFTRNIPNYIQGYFQQSLRNKLLIAFLGITVLSSLAIGITLVFLSTTTLAAEIQEDRFANLTALEHDIGSVLDDATKDAIFMTKSATTQRYMESAYFSGSDISYTDALAELETEIFELTAARGIYEEVRYINEKGQEIVRVNRTRGGGSYYLVPQNELQDKSDRYYFVESLDLTEGRFYVSPLDLTSEGGVVVEPHLPVVRFSTPVFYNGQMRGIMIVNVYADTFLSFLEDIEHPVFLVDQSGDFLYHPDDELTFGTQLDTGYNIQDEHSSIVEHLFEGESDIETIGSVFYAHTDITLPQQTTPSWSVVLYEPSNVVFSSVYDSIWTGIWVFLLVVAIASVISILLSLQISRPLLELTNITGQIAAGDYDVRADVGTGDEIGELGLSVNNMAQQVGNLVHDIEGQRDILEQRAIEMEASQRVTFAASERTTPEDFLNLIVNLIRDVFDMYHAQVYLLSDDKSTAELRESSGYAGRMLLQRRHAIPMDRTSLVTTAIKMGEAVLVSETEKDPNWLPNELLPETKSELVVPLVQEGVILGALDIQSRIPGFFSERSVPLFQQMTNQIAFLFENSSLLAEITTQTETLEQFSEQLRVSAEIAARLNTINNLDDLLEEAVNQLQVRFNFYHAHVYMPDEAGNNLVVQAGSGHVGYTLKRNKHSIPMDREGSLVARAARERQSVVVDNVTLAEDYMANPLLPNTHSEVAIPLMLGDRLIGVLDLQDEEIARFTPADVDTLQTLSGQIASSIESAQFFEEVQEAQIRFQTVADYTVDWETWLSEEDQYLYCSPSIERITGYSQSELIGHPPLFVEMVHPDDKGLVQDHVRDHRSVADVEAIEYRILAKDGQERWIRHSCQAVFDVQGGWIGRRGSNADITDRKLVDLEVQRAAERFEALVDNAPDAILTLDAVQQKFVDVNRRGLELFGYTREKFLILSPSAITAEFELDGSNAAEKSTEYIKRAMQGETISLERKMINSDGREFVVDFNLIKLPGSENLIRASMIDITDRKAARDTIVQGDRLKSEFLANMSHELRTPLNSIIGYTDVLLMGLDGDLDEEVQEDIKAIHDNGQHLLSLINDVLDLAKIEAGRMTLEVKPIVVKELLEELHKKNAGLVVNKNVEMKLAVAKGLPTINGDAHRLNQVLTNLISNAVKFTEKGKITLKAFEEGKDIVMQVIDTGIGIGEEDLQAIFDEFTQVDASYSRRAEGTGLGLTITQNLVKMHGGTITVESKLGKGSTFSLRIPVDNVIKQEYTMAGPVNIEANGSKKDSKAIA